MAPMQAMSGAMAAKLGVCVLGGALTAAGLLTARQERVHAVNDLSVSIQRRADADRSLWAMRIEIARRTAPEEVSLLLEGGESPILQDWRPPATTDVAEYAPLALSHPIAPDGARGNE